MKNQQNNIINNNNNNNKAENSIDKFIVNWLLFSPLCTAKGKFD